MDDHAFPSYVSSKAKSRQHQFGETGDCFVRELDFSRITLRLTEKDGNAKEGEDAESVVAKLQGQTLTTLQQCLYKPTKLSLKNTDGGLNDVVVKLRYLPVEMTLDASESINNSGTLRVDVLDAADLPSADRNGFSDPYCRFKLNGKEVYKTKVQKKTLHPAWNEFFEVQVPSRTGADFTCDVYDWDFGDKADHLGATKLKLDILEPMQAQEMQYALDGKSGTLRLKMLFKPEYVTRSRQGSSTFSGTFAPAGKVVGAPVKGVTKGASFLRRGFTGRGKGSKDEAMAVNGIAEGDESTPMGSPQGTPARATALAGGAAAMGAGGASMASDGASSPQGPPPSTPLTPHSRSRSYGSQFGGTPRTAEAGTAHVSIVSASGYPAGAELRVVMRMLGKSSKELHKTKAMKSSSGKIEYSEHENFSVPCTADTQFQAKIVDHGTLRHKDLGEGLFFVSDQGTGAEQTVQAGEGTLTLRTSFAQNTGAGASEGRSPAPAANGRNSPDSKRESRRSFFGRKDKAASESPNVLHKDKEP